MKTIGYIKTTVFPLLIFLLSYSSVTADTKNSIPGATLLDIINTGLSTGGLHSHLGMSLYDNALYLTDYDDDMITKVSLTDNSVAPGYPAILQGVSNPHGLAVDKTDGSIWVCDLNNKMIRYYSPSLDLLHSINIGTAPVNAIAHENKIYVADRVLGKIFVVDKSTLSIENEFEIYSYTAENFIDLFIYSGKLYIVSNGGLNGIVTTDLDGSNQEIITVGSEENFSASGIYIQNNRIYLNTGEQAEIIITDLSGTVLNSWDVDYPEGFEGNYIDIEVVGSKIYIASHSIDNDFCPHVLVYRENTMPFASIPGGSVEWEGTIEVKPFQMSTTEITNSDYMWFLNEALNSGYIRVEEGAKIYGNYGLFKDALYMDLSCYEDENNQSHILFHGSGFEITDGKERWPVTWVTWEGAMAFAHYYGYTLPTHPEFIWAFQGGRNYQYGTDDGTLSEDKANYNNNIGHPVNVGSYPPNPYGLYDICGNVHEYVKSNYGAFGGASHAPDEDCSAETWCGSYEVCPREVGFRVVYHGPEPALISPNGGEVFYPGMTMEIHWEPRPGKIATELFIGPEWQNVVGLPAIDGLAGRDFWTVPEIESEEFIILIFDQINGYMQDGSDNEFTILPEDTENTFEGIPMVNLPAGSFEMGARNPESYDYELPVHTVNISNFSLGKYEISQEQYEAIMRKNPSCHTVHNSLPVEDVSWYDAVRFCNRLSDICSFERCYDQSTWECDFSKTGFRLPTEAEWEYAYRAGTTSTYYLGDLTECTVSEAGWIDTSSYGMTHSVGNKPPNPWGLHDMIGNVSEWCHDWYQEDYYETSPVDNPTGPENGTIRVIRGSSHYTDWNHSRAAFRHSRGEPGTGIHGDGFRIARSTYSIEGRVIDDTGNPVAGVEMLVTGKGVTETVITDSNGEYSIPNLERETYTLMPSRVGYGFEQESIPVVVEDRLTTVEDITALPYLQLISPDGGEFWEVGTTQEITWRANYLTTVKLQYSADDGKSWVLIASGIDASAGSYSWRVPDIESTQCRIRVTDTVDANVTDMSGEIFTVTHPIYIKIIAPNGNEELFNGLTFDIQWEVHRVSQVRIDYTPDGGTRWVTIVSNMDASGGSYTWTVPDVNSSDCFVRITDLDDANVQAVSDAAFSIIRKVSLYVTCPNGRENLAAGEVCDITWGYSDVENIKLEYSKDNGDTWETIVEGVPASESSYPWTLPALPSSQCLVRITDISDNTVSDISDNPFTIGASDISVSIQSIVMGGVIVDSTKTKIFTITNEGNADLVVSSITSDNTAFIVEPQSATVPAGDSTDVTVTFTPSTTGEQTATITVASNDSDENTLDITVYGRGIEVTLQILSPISGERLIAGSVYDITWRSSVIENVTVEYSDDSGTTWHTVVENLDASTGSYSWTIPEKESSQYMVRITDSSGGDSPLSDVSGVFSVVSTAENHVVVLSPRNRERLHVGTDYEITWEYKGITNVSIELSTDGGTTWQTVKSGIPASSGSYVWTVPDKQSADCKIKISNVDDSFITGVSSGIFEIFIPFISIEHEPITMALENTSIVFRAAITNNTPIEEVNIHYDGTGERVFDDKLPMSYNGIRYESTLGSEFFTAYGIEYYITACDTCGLETRFPETGYFSIQARVSGMKSEVTVTGGSAQNAYRMISVPLIPTKTSIVYQLIGKLPPGGVGIDWRLFRWSPDEEKYKEYPDIGEGLQPGNAMWLIVKNGSYRLKSLEGTTVPTDQPAVITLLPGWNDISNPWLFPVSWSDMENPINASISEPYIYEGSWSEPGGIDVLEPWKGYSVRNNENFSVNIKLSPTPVKSIPKPVTDSEGIQWQLSIHGFAGEASDTANKIGVCENARIEWDQYDHVEPPPIGKYVSICFPHRDWKQYPYDYTVDFRPPANIISWDLDVRTNIFRETVTVNIEGVENIPEEHYVKVFDRDTRHAIDVSNNSFTFVSGDNLTERHFIFVVSDSENPELKEYNSEPVSFVLASCYPNPFNPSTTIQYELSRPGKVTISIYNTVGQKVEVCDMGNKDPGVHAFLFDASNLTSGIYFYHIDTGYASVTQKMLYMK